jgi:hypothetical protein
VSRVAAAAILAMAEAEVGRVAAAAMRAILATAAAATACVALAPTLVGVVGAVVVSATRHTTSRGVLKLVVGVPLDECGLADRRELGRARGLGVIGLSLGRRCARQREQRQDGQHGEYGGLAHGWASAGWRGCVAQAVVFRVHERWMSARRAG